MSKMTMTRINGEMLTLAREYRVMTQADLAEKTGFTQSLIAKIENGMKSDLDDPAIDTLCSTLGFPPAFFNQREDVLGFGSSAYFYRKKSTISAAERKRVHSTVNLSRIAIKKILKFVELSPSRTLPEWDIEEYGGSAAHIAKSIRGFWALPDGPIKNITALLESAGVIVVSCDFGTRAVDATSLRLTEMPPLIFINSDIPGDRWRFTLAHELAHLIMHRIPHEKMEDEADEFAAEFLVPEHEIAPQFRMMSAWRLPELAKLKEHWKVSIAMLVMRAKKLGVITDSQARYQFMALSKNGYRLNEPLPLEREVAINLSQMISAMTEGLGFTQEDIAETVMWYPQEAVRILPFQVRTRSHLRIVK
ncbi:MAG: ImmA/IrrE family metallo-endopeptidase [Streptococcus sp.]|jgi:Zn-dependent peptidase ImmA (M78 family)/DNA-binding XRE family transcriptional regulator|nr:ImmA/IrrE family metallo-endopeptidase [Streptococcus sp.]